MTPALFVSLLLGTLLGCVVYLMVGWRARSLVSCVLLGALTFLSVQLAVQASGVTNSPFGDVALVEGSIACLLVLLIANRIRV
jgi:hypothetical protein